MRTFRVLLTALMICSLFFSSVRVAQAQPPIPSNFYGSIQIQSGDGVPTAGVDFVDAYLPGITGVVVSVPITTSGSDLVYTINVPGDVPETSGVKEGGLENDLITFQIGSRVIGTALWHGGTNVLLNFHPPQAMAGGPYTVLAGATISLNGSANDDGSDASAYAWDLDGGSQYDDATGASPSYSNSTTGAYTLGLQVTDAQGGVGTATALVFVYTLGGLTGQVYDGNPHPVTAGGIVDPYSYTVTYDGSATAPTNAATYEVVVHIMNGANEVATITTSLVIAPKTASVTPDAKTKVYNEIDPTLTGTLVGFLPADGVTATYSRVAGETVADSPYTISATLNASGLLSNYNITSNTANFTITPASAVITLGNLNPTFTGSPLSPSVSTTPNGLPYSITYDGSSTTPTNAGTYALVVTITDTNYAGSSNGSFVIAKAPSTTTVSGGGSFEYDGQAHAATVSVTGAGGLTLSPSPVYSGSCTTAPVNVADTPCTASYTFTGDANHLGSTDSTSITITPRIIAVTADALTKVYGNADPDLTYTFTGTLVGTDAFTGALSRAAGEAVNSYAISQNSLALSSNYTLQFTGANLTITHRPITITADNQSKIIGAADPELTYQITSGSLVFTDTVSGSLVRAPGQDIGTYAITQGSLVINTNYALTFVPGVFEITGVQHSITLQPGWNLVSFAIHPADTTATAVLSSISADYDLVYAWDATGASSGSGNWLRLDKIESNNPDTLTNLSESMGFWVHITGSSPVTLVISGTLPTTTTIPLRVAAGGWNLIGFPSSSAVALPGALSTLSPNYSLVFSYRAADTADPWKMYDPYAAPYASDLAQMAPGWGYWIKISEDASLNVSY